MFTERQRKLLDNVENIDVDDNNTTIRLAPISIQDLYDVVDIFRYEDEDEAELDGAVGDDIVVKITRTEADEEVNIVEYKPVGSKDDTKRYGSFYTLDFEKKDELLKKAISRLEEPYTSKKVVNTFDEFVEFGNEPSSVRVSVSEHLRESNLVKLDHSYGGNAKTYVDADKDTTKTKRENLPDFDEDGNLNKEKFGENKGPSRPQDDGDRAYRRKVYKGLLENEGTALTAKEIAKKRYGKEFPANSAERSCVYDTLVSCDEIKSMKRSLERKFYTKEAQVDKRRIQEVKDELGRDYDLIKHGLAKMLPEDIGGGVRLTYDMWSEVYSGGDRGMTKEDAWEKLCTSQNLHKAINAEVDQELSFSLSNRDKNGQNRSIDPVRQYVIKVEKK